MYPYIRCYCGRPLGDIYELFKALRLKAYMKYFEDQGIDISPDCIPFSEDIKVELKDVFTELNIGVQCCKTRLLTQVEFSEYY